MQFKILKKKFIKNTIIDFDRRVCSIFNDSIASFFDILTFLFVEDSVYSDWIMVQKINSDAFISKIIEQSKIPNTILQSELI